MAPFGSCSMVRRLASFGSHLATFAYCFIGPRLYRIHDVVNKGGRNYEPNFMESAGNQMLSVIRTILSLTKWTSPIILIFLYRRSYFSSHPSDLSLVAGKAACAVTIVIFLSMFTRAVGRFCSRDYTSFQKLLRSGSQEELKGYDYEFGAREPDFSVADRQPSSGVPWFQLLLSPSKSMGYVFFRIVGRGLVYPGATFIAKLQLADFLNSQRAKLIEEEGGIRAKLVTNGGNHIDTMHIRTVDRSPGHGENLVICTDGNCGFYEFGIMTVPLEKGYSVLGWNHPGFGASSGHPGPEEEQDAIDAVIQYAIFELGFKPENIILYAWSIGGYAASWAAMTYPDIRGVFIDASFDNLVPLALAKTPAMISGLVQTAVENFMNLNIADQLIKYPGPITLVRRTQDEMITTALHPDLESNRGNQLLKVLLRYRYPFLVDELTLDRWLNSNNSERNNLKEEVNYNFDFCKNVLQQYMTQTSFSFPMDIGKDFDHELKIQMTIYFSSLYLIDFEAAHCTRLPVYLFVDPSKM